MIPGRKGGHAVFGGNAFFEIAIIYGEIIRLIKLYMPRCLTNIPRIFTCA